MTSQVTVRIGGQPTATIKDYTAQVPYWGLDQTGNPQPIITLGQRCNAKEASQGEFWIDDDANLIPAADLSNNLPSGDVVLWTEDAPGCPYWLARERIVQTENGRHQLFTGVAVGYKVTVEDSAADTNLLTLTAAWPRGAETDVARVKAIVETFLQGNPRLSTYVLEHFIVASPTVTMPAKTYPIQSNVFDMLQDCADTAGKLWYLCYHHAGGIPGTATVVTDWGAAVTGTNASTFPDLTVPAVPDRYMLAFFTIRGFVGNSPHVGSVGYINDERPGSGAPNEAFTHLSSSTFHNDGTSESILEVWALKMPSPSVGANGRVTFTIPGSFRYAAQLILLEDVDQATPYSDLQAATGTNLAPSVAVTTSPSQLVINGIGAINGIGHTWTSTPGGSSSQLWCNETAGGPGDPSAEVDGSTEVATGTSTTMSWAISSDFAFWGSAAVAINGETGGCSHLCMWYSEETDHTTYPRTVKITDDPTLIAPDASPPVIAPQWLTNLGHTSDGQDLITGLVSKWGASEAAVFVHDDTLLDAYDWRVDSYMDSDSVTEAQAIARASAILAYRKAGVLTDFPSLKLKASQTNLITAGMSIQIKTAVTSSGQNLGTWQTRRIAQHQFTPIAPQDDSGESWYRVDLQLGRAIRNMPASHGKAQAAATTPKTATDVSVGGGTGIPGTPTDVQTALTTLQTEISALSSSEVPYYIPAGVTYTVALYQQALFADPIEADGALVVLGELIGVD
ncbi:MAG TPA: hypothetical protein VK600_00455 [Candidatus Saccharimonadales bacterium]|nr:hypothetical protein [Candidatus Saccharimonadales bacterium]